MTMFDANDRRFMRRALSLARRGTGLSSPNPSVGCVIVRDGQIVGSGWHEYALCDHAEVRAFKEAGKAAGDATAYVTLEPCSHYGRTPPCANLLIESGIRRVVVARADPNPRVAGKGLELLRSAGIQVDVGLLAEEAGRIIESFARWITAGRPLVVSKVGMSLDGKIGTAAGGDRWITSPESREFGQQLRLSADAILVGVGTVISDDPELTYRGESPKVRPLIRVVLDSKLRIPVNARLFHTCRQNPVLIFCSNGAAPEKQEELRKLGAEVISVPSSSDDVDLEAVLQELGKRNVLELLVEGGSLVHWSFLSSRMVDKFYFIVAPVVLGGKDAVPSVGGGGYPAIADSPRFRIRKPFYSGPDIVLETYPEYTKSIISPWLLSENAPSAEPDPRSSSDRK